jgi:hypothetical protein
VAPTVIRTAALAAPAAPRTSDSDGRVTDVDDYWSRPAMGAEKPWASSSWSPVRSRFLWGGTASAGTGAWTVESLGWDCAVPSGWTTGTCY